MTLGRRCSRASNRMEAIETCPAELTVIDGSVRKSGSHLTRCWRGVDSNFRFRDALSSPTARPWSRPPDLAVSGGALNGHLTTPIGGRPATPRLTRREDRSAQLGRGPENLGNRAAANYRFLNGSAASVVCPDRSSRVTKSRSSINVMGRFRRSMLSFS